MDTKTTTSNPILGSVTPYSDQYNPALLHSIERSVIRQKNGIAERLPFWGTDIWNAYELSWLECSGKPKIAVGTFYVPHHSSHIIESKSFKLYLNSLNQTSFKSKSHLCNTLGHDLSQTAGTKVQVELTDINQVKSQPFSQFPGTCLDELKTSVTTYQVEPKYLATEQIQVDESVYTDLFRACCPVTNQPDWASILIHYSGNQIIHKALLNYLISFRKHREFHEACVERIFKDIMDRCCPKQLSVYARFTRRGGLDINPFRSNFESPYPNTRLWRQ